MQDSLPRTLLDLLICTPVCVSIQRAHRVVFNNDGPLKILCLRLDREAALHDDGLAVDHGQLRRHVGRGPDGHCPGLCHFWLHRCSLRLATVCSDSILLLLLQARPPIRDHSDGHETCLYNEAQDSAPTSAWQPQGVCRAWHMVKSQAGSMGHAGVLRLTVTGKTAKCRLNSLM